MIFVYASMENCICKFSHTSIWVRKKTGKHRTNQNQKQKHQIDSIRGSSSQSIFLFSSNCWPISSCISVNNFIWFCSILQINIKKKRKQATTKKTKKPKNKMLVQIEMHRLQSTFKWAVWSDVHMTSLNADRLHFNYTATASTITTTKTT